ncbi:nickel-dependent lactate racemase [Feifania hominis]|uniref:Nickel-dependent lactate racemase n=1 Tax=Feifania hominis TaxID=2763660 RepID=A0A926DEW0_9FIRM|nr:nickel-dependent lactate racemase [Feifania hominis]MBC8536561.1 nickel-dependent lactate racemase [Feifania hominis]
MKTFAIPYAAASLPFSCEESELRGVVRCDPPQADGDGRSLVAQALANPVGCERLRELARGAQRVLVITSDHTRPVPSHITLPPMLDEIRAGNPAAEIKILVATGVHRGTTRRELTEKFTQELVDREEFLVHDAAAPGMLPLGTLPSGCKLSVNPLVGWADLIVADGFIEPHFFAGFSGGRKSILPGIASAKSVMTNHCSALIGSARARTGILEGNPIHEDMCAAARLAGLRFVVNVLLDDDKHIVAAFAGDAAAAHEAGCRRARELYSCRAACASVVVTSNGGYPLDQNVYQTVKSMTAAESCVNEGGVILCAAACEDGSGGEEFVRWFSQSNGPRDVLDKIERIGADDTIADQWQAQILARVMTRASVALICEPKNREMVESMGLKWFADLDSAFAWAKNSLGERYDGVTVIPNGISVIVEEQ